MSAKLKEVGLWSGGPWSCRPALNPTQEGFEVAWVARGLARRTQGLHPPPQLSFQS